MSIRSLSIFTVLALAVNIILATPFTLPAAAPAQCCTNAPLTVAGTLLDRGTLSHRRTLLARRTPVHAPHALSPRVPEKILWCAPGTQTYVTILLTVTATAPLTVRRAIKEALGMAAGQITAVIGLQGDGIIPSGRYEYDFAGGVNFWARNANNHQQTYGVVGAAISALRDFMDTFEYCAVEFEVWDGGNQVGQGQIAAVG